MEASTPSAAVPNSPSRGHVIPTCYRRETEAVLLPFSSVKKGPWSQSPLPQKELERGLRVGREISALWRVCGSVFPLPGLTLLSDSFFHVIFLCLHWGKIPLGFPGVGCFISMV